MPLNHGDTARNMDRKNELSSDSLEESENIGNNRDENEFGDAHRSQAQELSPPQQLRRSFKFVNVDLYVEYNFSSYLNYFDCTFNNAVLDRD